MQQLKCGQHELPFSLFCDRCNEPVCDQCSIVGPHHTPIHSLSQLPHAYERRVKQIKQRLSKVHSCRDSFLEEIYSMNKNIQEIKQRKQVIKIENEKYENRMLQKLTKAYENVYNTLNKQKQILHEQYSTINDLGHQFQQMTDEIQCIVSYKKIIKELKEINDKTQIVLSKPLQLPQLPKQMTNIRIQLQKILSLQLIFENKKEILKSLITKLYEEKAKIILPTINYSLLLAQLQNTMTQNNVHYVCHFCGLPLCEQTMNSHCQKNKIHQNVSISDLKYTGFCLHPPDSVKFATHRHYFDAPKDQMLGYRSAFYNRGQNLYTHYLDALLLKLKTLMKIHNKNIKSILQKSDTNKNGYCELIVLQFALIQTCKLPEAEAEILCSIIKSQGEEYNYKLLLQQLNNIDI